MPSVNFVLPHWLYWSGLLIFPLVAMYLSRRSMPSGEQGYSYGVAYFVWLVGGFLGLHRLYLRNSWGLVFWPLFALILYASAVEREARVLHSDAVAELAVVESSIARKEKSITKSEATIAKTTERLETVAPGDRSVKRLERRILKEQEKIKRNRTSIEDTRNEVPVLQKISAEAEATRERWDSFALYSLILIAALLALDLFLIPSLLKKAAQQLKDNPEPVLEKEDLGDDREAAGKGLAGLLDRISLFTGEYVAFWSVIAVFVYYYEVVVRYVFNSPTNWAHESMFLMFGMQYLIAGSYAMLTESHVRVDIFYAKMSRRGKAGVDLLTSVFFFIFAGTLLVTGLIFSMDAIGQNEVSFTEWAVHYWPVKCVIVVGSLLLIFQGLSTVLKDIAILAGPSEKEGAV
ncbi:MAG: TRAP transporter small permease subunit [Sneathiellales bacterium]|nr:TRAP transporter small permease subunit [Sneathiellales bacterium]